MRDSDKKAIADLQLTETEQRYYEDVFIYCRDEGYGNAVSLSRFYDLLRCAKLPNGFLFKVQDIARDKKTSVVYRKQFYVGLKLVAAHQAGLEIHKDLVFAKIDELALPRFIWPSSTEDEEEEDNEKRFLKRLTKIKSRPRSRSSTESESEAESPRETESDSTDSPIPTNSVTQERNDGAVGGETNLDSVSGGWQSLLSEEQRQLLGTEEESSERHSSDEGDGEDGESFPPDQVWTINDEQGEYYTAQFAQLQPNPDGLLAGSRARKFFEKSRLPVEELRRIWQLADVTRDSALSLHEFYVAMHLAVLRRNHVPLPDVLPPSLAMLVETQSPQQAPPMAIVPPVPAPRASPTTRAAAAANSNKEKSKEWTKFVDSPTGTSGASGNSNNGGSLTSPGPKPVNFDFQKSAVERDPKILHPVPLRLTPEAAILASNANDNNGVVPLLGDDDTSLSAASAAASGLAQRPLAKKPGLPLPEETVIATPKKEPPPPPPPRPYRTHTRSSSLDLNKLGKNGQNFLGAPPLVPPRVSPGITSTTRKLVGQKSEGEGPRINNEEQDFVADFSQFAPKVDEIQTVENNVPPSQQFTGVCGAFHIYKKPSPRRGSGQDESLMDETEESSKKLTLQELREKNAELRQVCEELTRELAGALQERINLKAKLLLLT